MAVARGRKTVPERSTTGVELDEAAAQADVSDPTSAIASMLSELDEAAEVSITREQPGYAAGFVGTWEIHDRDPIAFLERLQAECGGAVYRVQPLRRQVNGRKYYSGGLRRVRISGPPMSEGRRWGADVGPPVVDTTGRPMAPVPRPTELAAEPQLPQNFLGILETLVTRLANLEARQPQQPFGAMAPQPPPRSDIDTTLATMKSIAELNKLLGGMQPREVFVDDDDDDEEPQGPPGIEDMIAMVIAKKYDLDSDGNPTPKTESAPAAGGPRLIREGADITNPEATPSTGAPTQAPAQAPASASDQGPEAVARIIAAQGPEEAVNFLLQMTKYLPADIQAGVQRAAMAQMAAQDDGSGTEG